MIVASKLLLGLLLSIRTLVGDAGAPAAPVKVASAPVDDRPALSSALGIEQQTLDRMLFSTSWPRQAVAVMRLERYGCDESLRRIRTMAYSPAWQMRAFAVRSLAVRGQQPPADMAFNEENPYVVRAILRCGGAIPRDRLINGVRRLGQFDSLFDKMLAVELAAASADPELLDQANETLSTIIHRMDRAEAGALSRRIAAVTGGPDFGRAYRWQDWWRKNRNGLVLRKASLLDRDSDDQRSAIAALDGEDFASLDQHLAKLATREVDLAIALDCTASMFSELVQCQAGLDELMQFVGAVCKSLRVGLVAYRDRRDKEFETRAWDFTDSIDEARRRVWSLGAEGGGDTPESVHPALKLAYGKLSWDAERTRVLVLAGDGPPHPGTGSLCEDLARHGANVGLTTHVVQAQHTLDRAGRTKKDIDSFPDIAKQGGGRCVNLDEGDSLVVEIAGLTLGERFDEQMQEFFRVFVRLCDAAGVSPSGGAR